MSHEDVKVGVLGQGRLGDAVADVSKALMSVHRVCEQGHGVLFSNSDRGSAMLIGRDVRNKIPLRRVVGTHGLDAWVKPNPDFIRQG